MFKEERTMGIELKTKEEIALMREAGRLVARTFQELEKAVQPGVKLSELDQIAAEFIEKNGAKQIYKGYRLTPHHTPFPGVITTAVNDVICHGIPDGRVLKEGDIVGIDIGLSLNGWCGDSCVTYAVGKISPLAQKLMKVAKEALYVGIQAALPNRRVSDIGAAIEAYVKRQGFSVVREWGGHGLGRTLHEEPSVPHWGPGGRGIRLRPGMTIAIEPMVNVGKPDSLVLDDGWTVVTADGSLSAQFEHSIAITEKGPEILTLP